ncbi:MAG TPA: PEP-CTERM sorting domain-containing protein [Anaerohalosphaeraceae bacterium]|nr:PEP-CTERM sorting domain-containing protein [Anaerohalosphaeraceae bacterium]
MKKFVYAGLAALLMWIPAASANLLTNGGFEDGNTGQLGVVSIPGWNNWGYSGWHHDDPGCMIGTKGMKFWWDDSGMWQDYAAAAGQTYFYCVQVMDAGRDTSPVNWDFRLEAEFYDSANTQLTAVVLGYFDSSIQPDDTWVQLSGSIMAPAGTAYGRVVLRLWDWQPNIRGAIYFDEVSVVPEPASLAALGLGGLLLGRRYHG